MREVSVGVVGEEAAYIDICCGNLSKTLKTVIMPLNICLFVQIVIFPLPILIADGSLECRVINTKQL